MSDYTLAAAPALGGYEHSFDGVHLRELTDLAIVSIALPLGGEDAANEAVEAAFTTALPAPGTSSLSPDEAVRLLRLGQDQAFALFTRETPDAAPFIANRLNGAVYTTDQSDVWVGLEVFGANARSALERICPIDLHPDTFAEGDVARTMIEHLGALILRSGTDRFLLLSASSSAGSFLHAVEVSIRNTS